MMMGGAGNDFMSGGMGADMMMGGAGGDMMMGGGGADHGRRLRQRLYVRWHGR